MAVNYFLENISKGFSTDRDHVYGCFGDLFFEDATFPIDSDFEKHVYEFEYISYDPVTEDVTNVLSIIDKFPWMKDIVSYDKKSNIFSFDLSKPADTVWFCLNLIRLICQPSNSSLNKVLFSEDGVEDLWKTFVYLESFYFYKGYSAKKYSPSESRQIYSTCIIAPNYFSDDFIKGFIENPLSKLNKLPSIIESKTGFKKFSHWSTEDDWDDDEDEPIEGVFVSFDKDYSDTDGLEAFYHEMLEIMLDCHTNKVLRSVDEYSDRTYKELLEILNFSKSDLSKLEEVINFE